MDLFYDLRFQQAIQAARDLRERFPEYPAGAFFECVAYYQLYLLEDPHQPKTFDQFMALNQKAFEQALTLEPSQPAISHYYQGAALGFQARAYIAQKKYADAIPKARQGVAHLRKALELDPSLIDANFGLGMYYYFLSRVPAAAKPFAYLMVGMKGNRVKGLALLHQVMENGRTARMEAKSVLAAIYGSEREKNWTESIRLYRELMKAYPHNPRYRLKLEYCLQRQGLWKEAMDTAAFPGLWTQELDPLVRQRAQELARYRTLENLLFLGQLPPAAKYLDALETSPLPPLLQEWVGLRRGNYLEAFGQRDRAKAFYSKMKHKKTRRLANEFQKTPFPQGPRDVMPSHWPVSNIPIE